MKNMLVLLLLLLCGQATANPLPSLAPGKLSPHKLFFSSETQPEENFDVWNIDGGYAYQVFDSVDLYVGARVNNSQLNNQSGFLSGVSYKINEHFTLKSTLRSFKVSPEDGQPDTTGFAAEVSSRVKITESLDLHATLDYQEWQQGIEVGIGFRF
ncbi:ribonuclease regulator [Vibrio navarrensis]|jgi:hypothetical protein|uniref:Ribonuclease regulator n=1 Tax=Vibrio navarrensis TaxID=29495 RepID=A0A099LT22_9VIBR|nr:ribonuclease regulator [Vibrio navarrensis]EJL6395369.1 ribonuclease regulator [Vibrio navarrensis]EJL6398990.1 ribonuclease regulator [Vibrio navarrensis]EJL6567155.1 ribonuclease regulator [Vibrio navarrensis]EKA5634722.1 ribonuclease regulator [Vibrio navarrensis]ELN6933228.1 ribonuclease regulator [Vibrio navarrensis]